MSMAMTWMILHWHCEIGCQVMINSRLINEGEKHVNSNSAPAPFRSNTTVGIFQSFLQAETQVENSVWTGSKVFMMCLSLSHGCNKYQGVGAVPMSSRFNCDPPGGAGTRDGKPFLLQRKFSCHVRKQFDFHCTYLGPRKWWKILDFLSGR